MLKRNRIPLPIACLASTALAACGSSAPDPATQTMEKYVYVSAKDCADKGKLGLARCGELIDKAVVDHDRLAPTYKTERACEAAEGAERCEVAGQKNFRPRLVAFAVVVSGSQSAAGPLYLTLGGEAGFRTFDRQLYLTTDESIAFSPSALALYEATKLAASPLATAGKGPL